MQRLKDLGALTKTGELTPLGRHLALLPIDVQLGKVLIYGTMLRCVVACALRRTCRTVGLGGCAVRPYCALTRSARSTARSCA